MVNTVNKTIQFLYNILKNRNRSLLVILECDFQNVEILNHPEKVCEINQRHNVTGPPGALLFDVKPEIALK